MINIFKLLVKFDRNKQTKQAILLDFVNNTENIKKAAKGSMEKRIDLIERVHNGQPA